MVNSLHQESLIKVKAFLAQNSMKHTFSKSFPFITVCVEFLFRWVDRIRAISTVISLISVRDGVRSWVEWVGSPRGTDARWEGGKTVAHGSFFKPLLSTECGYILVFANFFFNQNLQIPCKHILRCDLAAHRHTHVQLKKTSQSSIYLLPHVMHSIVFYSILFH